MDQKLKRWKHSKLEGWSVDLRCVSLKLSASFLQLKWSTKARSSRIQSKIRGLPTMLVEILGPLIPSHGACASGYLTPGEMLSFAFTQLMWASLWTFGGVCIDTALLCSRRKTWSHLTLLIASWLIRFTRNCQTLKPQIIISHNKRIYCAINFFPSRFSKSEITNCCKTFIAYFNLFLPPVRKCLKELFWSSPLSLFLCIKNNICVYLFNPLSVWNLCHSGTVKGKSSLSLSAPKGQRQEKSIKILVFRVWMGRTRCLLHICGSGKEEDEHEFNFPASWVKYMAWKQSTRLVSLLCLCVSMEKGPMSAIEYYSGKTADFWPPQEMQRWWISFCMVGASSWQPQFSTRL